MKALMMRKTGSIDGLSVEDVPDRPLAAGEVRIKVEAAAVNPSDIANALGKFPQTALPRIVGRDFAGVIVDGPKELVGKAVWGSGGGELGLTRDGAHAEFVDVPANAVAERPSHLTAQEAAAIGVPFITAWSALMDLAPMKPDEVAIVSGAAGAVGAAAIAIITALGARAIALVVEGTDLTPLDGLNVAGVAYSERNNLTEVTHGLTQGRGADIALNGVGAPVFQPLLDALAKGGRMVVFSAAAGREVQLDLFAFYRGRYTFYGLDTAHFSLDHIAGVLGKLNPLFESNKLRAPKVDARYPLSDAREAYHRVKDGKPGKVVITPG